jgi:hypothetical protein
MLAAKAMSLLRTYLRNHDVVRVHEFHHEAARLIFQMRAPDLYVKLHVDRWGSICDGQNLLCVVGAGGQAMRSVLVMMAQAGAVAYACRESLYHVLTA